jgi:hypothetical protein
MNGINPPFIICRAPRNTKCLGYGLKSADHRPGRHAVDRVHHTRVGAISRLSPAFSYSNTLELFSFSGENRQLSAPLGTTLIFSGDAVISDSLLEAVSQSDDVGAFLIGLVSMFDVKVFSLRRRPLNQGGRGIQDKGRSVSCQYCRLPEDQDTARISSFQRGESVITAPADGDRRSQESLPWQSQSRGSRLT